MSNIILRDYQKNMVDAWRASLGRQIIVLPTGGGKTVVFAEILRTCGGPCVAIAHRSELVTQISTALARCYVQHSIIGPRGTIRSAIDAHIEAVGSPQYDPYSPVSVAGVDTLIRRDGEMRAWRDAVRLVVIDEAHHCLPENKWGKAVSMFPNARVLGVTATPTRTDGKPLKGIFSGLIVGPPMRELIDRGYLTPYRIFAPPSDLDLSQVNLSASGDYSPEKLKKAVQKSRIVGDVVKHYMANTMGKLGVTFATDVETAGQISEDFNAAGVPSRVVSAKTPEAERAATLKKFRNRELLQLVNVDLFGEGFDLPAIEVVSMARPTQSYSLFSQQFGRALRILPGKTHAFIFDHVGNTLRHGLPDFPREWSLEGRDKKTTKQEAEARVKTCQKCFLIYEPFLRECPFCGHVPEVTRRSSPEEVQGDLTELTYEAIETLRAKIKEADRPVEEVREKFSSYNIPRVAVLANVKRHHEAQITQGSLRPALTAWWHREARPGDNESRLFREFYTKFGVDFLSAQSLKSRDAEELLRKLQNA